MNGQAHSRTQLQGYRNKIRSAYREGSLSAEQISKLESAGFAFETASRQALRVVDLTTGETFPSLREAGGSVGSNGRGVRNAMERRRLLNGHAFWFVDDPNPPDVSEFLDPDDPRNSASAIIDLATGEVYSNVVAAVAATGITRERIRFAMRDKRLLDGHAFWRPDGSKPPDISDFREGRPYKRPVVDLVSGEVYPSRKAAAEACDVNVNTLISAMDDKRIFEGHAFCFTDDPNPPALESFRCRKTKRMGVEDVTTGETYESVRAAARSLGMNGGTISWAIKSGRAYKGHVFRFADDIGRG